MTTEDVDGFSKLSIATGQKQSGLKTFNASTSAVNVPKLFDDDMPVDPNEPLFCLCQQVSFGEMIMCDNPNVSIIIIIPTYLKLIWFFIFWYKYILTIYYIYNKQYSYNTKIMLHRTIYGSTKLLWDLIKNFGFYLTVLVKI